MNINSDVVYETGVMKENEIYMILKKSLDTIPDLPKFNHNNWIEKGIEVKQSGKFNLNNWRLNTN